MLTAIPQLTPSTMRILQTILRMDREGKRLTIRSIADECGFKVHGQVAKSLNRLRIAGLVTWEYGSNGTIRPTCRWIPADCLESEAYTMNEKR